MTEVFHVFQLVTLPLDAVVQNGRIVNYESERMWKRVAVGTVLAFVWD
jgi:hypothetical protein